MMAPTPMSRLDLVEFLALFIREIDCHLPVRLGNRLMNTPGSFLPNLSKLPRRFIDNRRNFRELFRRQVELGA